MVPVLTHDAWVFSKERMTKVHVCLGCGGVCSDDVCDVCRCVIHMCVGVLMCVLRGVCACLFVYVCVDTTKFR